MVLHLRAHRTRGVHHGRDLRHERVEDEGAPEGLRDLPLEPVHVAVQVERHVSLEHALAREAKALLNLGQLLLGEVALHLQTHGLQALPALQHLLHVLAVVLFLLDALAVRVDVSVSRHADHGRGGGGVVAKAAAQHLEHRVLHKDVAILALRRGQLDDAPERGGNLNDAQKALLVRTVERARHVQVAVAEVGEGVPRVDDHRRYDRCDGKVVRALDLRPVRIRQVLARDAREAVLGKAPLDGGERAPLTRDEVRQHPEHGVDLLGRRLVRLVLAWLVLQQRQVAQAADPDHEPLVEVAPEDGDELQPLEQGNGLVKGLVQHAVVKAQPADLPVLRIREVPRLRMGALLVLRAHVLRGPLLEGRLGVLEVSRGLRARRLVLLLLSHRFPSVPSRLRVRAPIAWRAAGVDTRFYRLNGRGAVCRPIITQT